MSDVRVIRPSDRTDTTQTAGMVREEAVRGDGFWSGIAIAEPGSISGWHHHGDHDSIAFVLAGTFRLEFGPGGRQSADAQAGDFMFIPKGLVHREGNPSTETSRFVVVRIGTGEPVINVEGPEVG